MTAFSVRTDGRRAEQRSSRAASATEVAIIIDAECCNDLHRLLIPYVEPDLVRKVVLEGHNWAKLERCQKSAFTCISFSLILFVLLLFLLPSCAPKENDARGRPDLRSRRPRPPQQPATAERGEQQPCTTRRRPPAGGGGEEGGRGDTEKSVFQIQLFFRLQCQRKYQFSRSQQRQSTRQQYRDRSNDQARQTHTVPIWCVFSHEKNNVHKENPFLSHGQRRNVKTAVSKRKISQLPLLSQKLHQH